jgi:hypothetical protein
MRPRRRSRPPQRFNCHEKHEKRENGLPARSASDWLPPEVNRPVGRAGAFAFFVFFVALFLVPEPTGVEIRV